MFPLSLSSLVPIAGSNVADVMSNVTEMRILSAQNPEFIGDQVVARLGVDNITALPEPGTFALVFLGAWIGVASRRIRGRFWI